MLIVEHDVFSYFGLKTLLESYKDGFEMDHDVSGLETIYLVQERYRRHGDFYKLIMVSNTQIGVDGITLCQDLQKHFQ